jgi:RNA-binding protein
MDQAGALSYTWTMIPLTPKQRAHLRSLANHLKPVAQIGSGGINHATLQSIREAFNTRELLKVRVLESAPAAARATAGRIERDLGEVQVVQVVGHVVTLYRPFPEEPEIRLPER